MHNRPAMMERYGYVIAVGSILCATPVFLLGRTMLGQGIWAFLYLLIIGMVAMFCGARAALMSAMLAILAWNFFFIPPLHTLTITSSGDVIALAVFAVVGVTMGVLAGRLRAREQAARQEAERLRATLMSSVSHELKTPLSAMTATVSSLLGEDVAWGTAAVREELQALQENLARLHSSIDALLDLARLETEAWQPQRDWYELGEILGTALSHFPAALQDRIVDRLPDDGPSVYADFGQLARVMQHLIENALAYAPAGTPIEIGAVTRNHAVQWWVQDAGPGVPEHERDRIFEKFYRGSQAGRSPSGTGLGLAIAAEIIRGHGGRIRVDNVQPHGARFVIILPVPPQGGV